MDNPSIPHEPPFKPVGVCIYCGCTEDLKIEHVVPQGLGGRFELPRASCAKCEGVTSYVEGAVLRGIYHAPRARMGLLSKKRKKEHPREWPIEIDFGTATEPKQVPIANHPTFLFGLILNFPTILAGFMNPEDKEMVFMVRQMAPEAVAEHGSKIKVSARWNGLMFARMLAKIAHAYATAKLGHGTFKPLLIDIIRDGTDKFPLQYVGGTPDIPPRTDALHEISIERHDEYLVVRLRLFSVFGMPVYRVVVGT